MKTYDDMHRHRAIIVHELKAAERRVEEIEKKLSALDKEIDQECERMDREYYENKGIAE